MTDFDDWEMLQPDAEELEEMGQGGVGVEAEGLMMLRLDHFSVDSCTDGTSELSSVGISVESDNPGWIDPDESDVTVICRRDSGELWPDSGIDRSKMSDCGEKVELEFGESGDDHVCEVGSQRGFGKLGFESGEEPLAVIEFEGVHEVENMIIGSDGSVDKMDMVALISEEVTDGSEMGAREEERSVVVVDGGDSGKEVENSNEEEKKTMIWWKIPLELVKFCVFRVSPLWSISVAAAMLGVFIMRRRLQNMKRKSKSLQMKVTVDHKKVDQFMSRVARLNEAFSVVRRVPIIRPSLPSPGATSWSVMNIR